MFQKVLGSGTKKIGMVKRKWSPTPFWAWSWHTDPPEFTSYAWEISHALATTYHLYCHSPGTLTEYLKEKLHRQQAKWLSRSLPTQVKLNVPLRRNINSDFTLAATSIEYLERRGECNVPKRYLKDSDWCEDGPLGTRYYIADSDDPTTLITVDFNFKFLQWGCTYSN